VLFFV